MTKQTELSLKEIAEYFETHCESQYFHWKILEVRDIQFVNGFTVATVKYEVGKPKKPMTIISRWSYRREDWDNRIIAYFHDESEVKR